MVKSAARVFFKKMVVSSAFHRSIYVYAKGCSHKSDSNIFNLTSFSRQFDLMGQKKDEKWEQVPKRIFFLWFQGLSGAPDIVQCCLNSWQNLNPDYEVVFLDESNLGEWLDGRTYKHLKSGAHRSDFIRLELLQRYGGFWADATTLCIAPLQEWIGEVPQGSIFVFSDPGPDRIISNWFLAAPKGSALVSKWLRVLKSAYFWNRGPLRPYYIMHYVFEFMTLYNEDICASWKQMEKLSADGPQYLGILLDGQVDEETLPSEEDVKKIPLFKLSWKNERHSVQGVQDFLRHYNIEIPF